MLQKIADRRNWLEKHLLVEKRLSEHVWTFFLKILKTDYKESNLTVGLSLQIANSKREKIHQKITRYANSGSNIILSGTENVGVKWCTKINWKYVTEL